MVMLLLLLLAASASTLADAAKLLLVPLASESHISAFTALSTELELHGRHDVTMVVSSSLLGASKAMAAARNAQHQHSYLTYPFRFELFAEDMAGIAKANSIKAMAIGYKVLTAMTDMVIGDKELLQEIKALNPDLIIGDSTAGFGQWLTSLTGIPSIEFDVGTSSGLLHSIYGGQFNPAYVPAPGTFFPSTGMTLVQRCINTAVTLAVRAIASYHIHFGPVRDLSRRRGVQHVPGQGPHRPLLLLVNFDFALEPARPIGPSTKYLGPLIPRPAAELPDDLRLWLEQGRADGGADAEGQQSHKLLPVIYLSFGASFSAPQAAIPAVTAALAAASPDMRFIVSMRQPEQELLQAALGAQGVELSPQQLLLREHVPQNDLLGHGGVTAFVTQGGYMSMQEAAFHSVPVISIPLSLGQEEISQFAADQGRGLVVRKETLLAGDPKPLTDALRQIASNTSFKEQAEIVSARLRAHPRSPGLQAADWVAYALAIPKGSGSFLHTQGQDMRFWQVVLMDVVAVYAVMVVLLLLLLWQGAKWLLLCLGYRAVVRLTEQGKMQQRLTAGSTAKVPKKHD